MYPTATQHVSTSITYKYKTFKLIFPTYNEQRANVDTQTNKNHRARFARTTKPNNPAQHVKLSLSTP